MDILVLDKNLSAVSVLDSYNSIIWTDRYNEYGDFEVYTRMTSGLLDFAKIDYYLSSRDSEHTMIIEKILITSDAEDGHNVTISGRSLESILDRRIIWTQTTIDGNLQNGIKKLLTENIISPSKPERKIANFVFKESSDPAITSLTISGQYTGDNLYDVVSDICKEKSIGFKVTLNDANQFVFELYAGADRSYDQMANPFVVFSSKFDNLISSNYVETQMAYKNVTLVGGEGEGSNRRYIAVGNTPGLERKELFTDARDISSSISEDLTESFVFTEFASQVFNINTKKFVTDALFNSSTADISAYVGRTIRISVPKYSNSEGKASGYATVILDANSNYLSTVKAWDAYPTYPNVGMLESYEFIVPENAKYLYSSMYSQKAIDDDVYHGNIDDFYCEMTKLSNSEYNEQLKQRGKENLSDYADTISFEGEAETSVMFVYGVDFFIGDIVQVADDYGHETKARITELVMSENEEGRSAYPTFSIVREEQEYE